MNLLLITAVVTLSALCQPSWASYGGRGLNGYEEGSRGFGEGGFDRRGSSGGFNREREDSSFRQVTDSRRTSENSRGGGSSFQDREYNSGGYDRGFGGSRRGFGDII